MIYSEMTDRCFNHIGLSYLIALLLLTSCVRTKDANDLIPHGVEVADGESFTTTIAVDAELLRQETLKGSIEDVKDVTSLRLLVFDDKGRFLYSSDATVGSVVSASGKSDEHFLPDAKMEGITEIKQFKVSLYKSSQKRIVHFVANHDWSGFPQDYFAHGKHAGEFMTHETLVSNIGELEGGDPTKMPLWCRVSVGTLDENTFDGKVVKLLRNYAKLSLEINPAIASSSSSPTKNAYFDLEGYTLINLCDRGAIAPFYVNGAVVDFAYSPTQASLPTGVQLHFDEDAVLAGSAVLQYKSLTEPFYLYEKDNLRAEKKVALILKGHRYNKDTGVNETRYYKVDIVRRNKPTAGMYGTQTYFDIIRNKHYRVYINAINSDGFKTLKEAIQAPSGNNVFADTKLEDYKKISDGTYTLTVDPIQLIVVRPGIYTVKANYLLPNSTPDHTKYLKYYPSWDAIDEMRGWKAGIPDGESGYMYSTGTDPYMGYLRKSDEGFQFEVKEIPEDAIPTYEVEVVALRQYNGTSVVDGVSGATVPISRKVRITLTTPYQFQASLSKPASNDEQQRILKFRVYQEINKNNFPFPVYIKASGLTPNNSLGNKNILVEHLLNPETGRYEVYYKYMVKESDQANGWVELPFIVNEPSQVGTGDVKLTSDFYQTDVIFNDKSTYYRARLDLSGLVPTGDASPTRTGTKKVPISQAASISFNYKGEDLDRVQLFDKFGISLQGDPSGDPGKFTLEIEKNNYEAIKSLPLKFLISQSVTGNAAYGFVKYYFEKELTVAEWMTGYSEILSNAVASNIEFPTVKVDIEGRIYHSYYISSGFFSSVEYTTEKPNIEVQFVASYSQNRYQYYSPYQDYILTNDFVIKDQKFLDHYNYIYYNFVFSTTNIEALKYRPYLKVIYPTIGNTNIGYSAKTLSELESTSQFKVVVNQ